MLDQSRLSTDFMHVMIDGKVFPAHVHTLYMYMYNNKGSDFRRVMLPK